MDKKRLPPKKGQGFYNSKEWQKCRIKKEWNKSMLDTALISGLIQTAQMLVAYNNALIENGMSKEDALKMTIAYQGQQIEAATKASIEEKKNIMLLGKFTANN
jgi:hypothetical protein